MAGKSDRDLAACAVRQAYSLIRSRLRCDKTLQRRISRLMEESADESGGELAELLKRQIAIKELVALITALSKLEPGEDGGEIEVSFGADELAE